MGINEIDKMTMDEFVEFVTRKATSDLKDNGIDVNGETIKCYALGAMKFMRLIVENVGLDLKD